MTIAADAPTPAQVLTDRIILGAVMLALFLAALEQTIVGPAMGDIATALGGGALLPWTATAYLLAATAAAPILGAVADLRGRKLALLICVGAFLAGSLAAALSTSLPMLVAARTLQGAGAGGLTSLPFIVIADRVPMHRRAVFSAYISTIYAVAGFFGPVAGGMLAEYLHWSAIFWINVPLCLLVIAAVLFGYRADKGVRQRSIDFIGALLLIGGTTSSVLALEAATTEHASLLTAALWLALALGFWAAFGWRMTHAKSPLVPLQILTEPTILLCALGLLCCQGANIGMSLYLPLYFQHQFALSASQAGFAILGLVIGVMIGAYLPPRLLLLDPRYKTLCVLAATAALVASLALAAVLAFMPLLVGVEIAAIAMGLGIGCLYPVFTIATQNAAGSERMGAAIGILGFMRAMGGTIGVATIGSVAVASGLTRPVGEVVVDAAIPMWTISLVAAGLLAVCLLAMTRLPPRALEGFSKK